MLWVSFGTSREIVEIENAVTLFDVKKSVIEELGLPCSPADLLLKKSPPNSNSLYIVKKLSHLQNNDLIEVELFPNQNFIVSEAGTGFSLISTDKNEVTAKKKSDLQHPEPPEKNQNLFMQPDPLTKENVFSSQPFRKETSEVSCIVDSFSSLVRRARISP